MDHKLDAIGIGARRCASSYIHRFLNNHPDILKPSKGLHYFSEHYSLGSKWYLSQIPENAIGKLVIESSVSYSYPEYSEYCAKRIFNSFPDAKIFVSLRNPIDRAFSDYLRSIRNLEIDSNLSFEQAIKDFPIFLERGKYKKILSPYFDYFPSDNIKILLFDDLYEDSKKFQKSLCNFLNIREDINYIETGQKENQGSLRIPFLQIILIKFKTFFDKLAKLIFLEKIWYLTKKRFSNSYHKVRNLNIKKVDLSKKSRCELANFYQEDIDWLSKKINRDLSFWKDER